MDGEQHQYCSPHRVRRPFRRAELPARLASRSRTAGERFKGSKAWWAWASAESGSKQAARMRLKREQRRCAGRTKLKAPHSGGQLLSSPSRSISRTSPSLIPKRSEMSLRDCGTGRPLSSAFPRAAKKNLLSPLQRKYFVGHPVFLLGSLTQFHCILPGFALRAGSATMAVYLGLANGFLPRSAFLLPHVTR